MGFAWGVLKKTATYGAIKYKIKKTKLNMIINFTVLPMIPEQEKGKVPAKPVEEAPLIFEEESPEEKKDYVNQLIKDLL